jgi:hypothetical protein
VITLVREVAALARSPDGVLGPPEENGSLSDVERARAVLEHLWNKTAVHGWGPLVILVLLWC